MPAPIVILDYDPAWPEAYERERRLIKETLSGLIIAIEHIGSTAVPGLGAKPIVDLMAGIGSFADAAACIMPLWSIEYCNQPEIIARLRLHDDSLFVKWSMGRAAVHLHVTEYGGRFWHEKLLFRDLLRTHPDVAREYEALKRTLAPQFSDGPSYSTAKTAFIQAALHQARQGNGTAEGSRPKAVHGPRRALPR